MSDLTIIMGAISLVLITVGLTMKWQQRHPGNLDTAGADDE